MPEMTIGQLAAAAGVNVETVRYYHRRGLLSPPERPVGSIGRYPASALTRLRFIKRSQSLGFSLDDVQALLSLDDGQACTAARDHWRTQAGGRARAYPNPSGAGGCAEAVGPSVLFIEA
jgi:DNA-binding transcriptional MerR regulator